jgi:uncharacterized cupin superfamily protein
MGYHHVDVGAIEPTPDRPSTQRSLSGAAGLDQLGAHVYEVDPGEQIPLAYHYHDQQEELFYVLSGSLAVETPDEIFSVDADEAFVVEPESPQRAFVPESADEPARALVVGAPAVDDAHAYDGE